MPGLGSIILPVESQSRIDRFVASSRFRTAGAVFTDLDGTAVVESEGRVYVSGPMELGLKRVYDAGRPVALNSLRFPLSVLRTFGAEWYRIAGTPIPVVSLNGSSLGRVAPTPEGDLAYHEIAAFPLEAGEIEEVLVGVRGMLDAGVDDLVVFYYPRCWRAGEILWTPRAERVRPLAEKYRSAAAVHAEPVSALRERLLAEPICMIFLLVDVPEDRLMAYQHTQRTRFVTHRGVDKLFGAERMAELLGVELEESVGAGDSEMDTFLRGVGLAVVVGSQALELKGRRDTVRVRDSTELGVVLGRLAEDTRPGP
jgi:hypothetical protein